MNIFLKSMIAQYEPHIKEIKKVAIQVIDRETNLGHDRAELIVNAVIEAGANYLKGKGVI